MLLSILTSTIDASEIILYKHTDKLHPFIIIPQIIMKYSLPQGVLRELEQKKPQLDELLHTAESLKGTENRQQLHGKGT